MKRSFKILSVLASVAMSFTLLIGCGKNGASADEYADIWTAPGTVKILKDREADDALRGNALKVSMAKNEYEGAQIILSPKADISYDISAGKLVNENGKEFPADRIEFFNQHYIETTSRSNNNVQLGPGWYPEALIPLDKAREKKELNASKTAENQGIWVKFHTAEDTQAGIYSGKFSLTVNGAKAEIPVFLTVWNYVVPAQSHARTAFLNYQDSVIQGEGDNSDEMMEAYYEFFLENRITVSSLPAKADDDERFLQMLKKYYAHPAMTGYAVPYVEAMINNEQQPDYEKLKITIKKIIDLSIEDKVDYLKKGYFYVTLIDEFDQVAERQGLAKRVGENIDSMLVQIEKELLSSDKDFFTDKDGTDFLASLRQSLRQLPNMAVAQPSRNQDLIPYFEIWAIPAIYINSKANRDNFDKWLSGEGREHCETWWYTCIGPENPHVSYHIDDYLLSARATGWMQKDYGLAGNLYWSSSAYVRRVDGDNERPVDPYTTPNRFGDASVNGDGYLVYPGAKYGVYGPIGSVRTEAIRDAGEDYESLWLLEQAYEELSAYYGIDLDADETLRSVYDSLYTGAQAYTNTATFETARETVAGLILDAQSDNRMIVENVENLNDGIQVSILINGEASLTKDGEALTGESVGQGKRYVMKVDYSDSDIYLDFEYKLGGKDYSVHRFVTTGTGYALRFTAENTNVFQVTGQSEGAVCIESYEGVKQVYRFGVQSVFTGNATTDLAYEPSILVKSDIFGKDTKGKIRSLRFKFYNPGTADVKMTVKLYRFSMDIVDYTLKPGWNSLEFNNIQDFDSVTGIIFAFKNAKDEKGNPVKYDVYMADFIYQLA